MRRTELRIFSPKLRKRCQRKVEEERNPLEELERKRKNL